MMPAIKAQEQLDAVNAAVLAAPEFDQIKRIEKIASLEAMAQRSAPARAQRAGSADMAEMGIGVTMVGEPEDDSNV